MVGAHPTKLFGQDAHSKLDGLLAQRAARLIESEEVRPLDSHIYRCYLSKDGVRFYQIFDNFALGGLEVTIPHPEAVKLASPNSPLQRFATKE